MAIQSNFPAIKPSLLLDFANTKQLDPRITYTRASTATFYNGVTTAKAEENLFTSSQTFDTTGATGWGVLAASVTANTNTAPDGTSTADTLTEDTTTSTHYLSKGTTQGFTFLQNQSYVLSVYAKNITGQYVVLNMRATSGNSAGARFDLTGVTATTYTQGTGVSSSSAVITDVGSGWYRCSVVVNSTAAVSSPVLTISMWDGVSSTIDGVGAYTYTGTSRAIVLWGAQFEQRSAVTSYTPTTTQAITNYIPALQTAASGVARFDNNPTTGESLGLLIEESRTNLFTYSSDLSNAIWTKGGTTITSAANVAPDGTLTAQRLVEDTSTGDHRAFQGFASFISGTSYTFSVMAKQSGRSILYMTSATAALMDAAFDLSAGTVTSNPNGTASIVSLGNGWYRCSISATASATTNSNLQIRLVSTGTTVSYTGNGFSGLFIWGAQLEAGAFATSYIPTVASQVTRAADAASITGTNFSSWYNQAEGSLYSDFVITRTGTTDIYISSISNGTTTNDSILLYAQPANSRFRGDVYVGNSAQCAFTYTAAGAPTSGTAYKATLTYKVNDFAMSINSATVSTDTAGNVPVVDRFFIGVSPTTANVINGTIKKIAYYPLRVTNAQLQALTS